MDLLNRGWLLQQLHATEAPTGPGLSGLRFGWCSWVWCSCVAVVTGLIGEGRPDQRQQPTWKVVSDSVRVREPIREAANTRLDELR